MNENVVIPKRYDIKMLLILIATERHFVLTKFCLSTLSPKMRFKNLPTSLASLSFTTKLVSVTPMDRRHCYEKISIEFISKVMFMSNELNSSALALSSGFCYMKQLGA